MSIFHISDFMGKGKISPLLRSTQSEVEFDIFTTDDFAQTDESCDPPKIVLLDDFITRYIVPQLISGKIVKLNFGKNNELYQGVWLSENSMSVIIGEVGRRAKRSVDFSLDTSSGIFYIVINPLLPPSLATA